MPATDPKRYTDPLRGTRTKQEAARLVGCGDVKIGELVAAGLLTFIPVGNRQLITVTSLERLLGRPLADWEARTQAVAAPAAAKATRTAPARRNPESGAEPAPKAKPRRSRANTAEVRPTA